MFFSVKFDFFCPKKKIGEAVIFRNNCIFLLKQLPFRTFFWFAVKVASARVDVGYHIDRTAEDVETTTTLLIT